ncbi:beta-glucosidase [Butyrivibrio sp. WCD3002]|uniref:beta-glucosidase n=1 Tax=Butyrivibrio sp. WCD3002 TaxID=1280676 RepID=UPI0003F9B73C|nr:glycoside hydrolase family 3 C-terminal domain-containing protein [Butyrivibrio sp. WCD3002]
MATDIKKLVSEMTLEEKASLLGGDDFWHTKAVERLGIPKFMMSDGPHGLRKQDTEGDHLGVNDSIKAVCFPAACATASSFDTDMIGKMGEAIGDECQAEDLSIVLGPAVNIKRSPLCGRNFEYFSEDPYLAGKMAAAYINGVQSRHVGTSIKHFALNNQEFFRMSNSSEASERTMREIYFPAFEIAVRESQPKTVMCSYNKINGTYASDNEWLLTKVLRDDWGYEGFVMTDWGAVDDRVQGVRAGLELEMPGNTAENDAKIVAAVKSGELDEKLVDRSCERILKVVYDYFDNKKEGVVFDRDADHEKATEIAAECAVLLENNGILPLDANKKIVYIGEYAEAPRYQGGGSSHINSSKVTSALESAKAKGRNVEYVKGFPAQADEPLDKAELDKALAAAKSADAVVIFAGLPDIIESEGYDREDMNMPAAQNELIEAVAEVNENVVVVLHNGSPVETPWADDVAAILEMYLGGQGVGEATDKLLYGEKNPSGHLAETFPMRVQDNPSYLNFNTDPEKCYYSEGVYVGYRYYDKKMMPVRWAFGHGLSYTTFELSNLRVSSDKMSDDTKIKVCVDVKNTGSVAGKEVVQLYVGDLNGTPDRPVKELKGFAKVEVAPGETKTVEMEICSRALSYFDEGLGDWFAPTGKYELLVGNASDNITLRTEISFETKKIKPMRVDGSLTVGELMANAATAPIIGEIMKKAMENSPFEGAEENDAIGDKMMQEMIKFMPVKSLKSFGMMNDEQAEQLLDAVKAALSK